MTLRSFGGIILLSARISYGSVICADKIYAEYSAGKYGRCPESEKKAVSDLTEREKKMATRKRKKKNNNSSAYLSFLIMLALGIIIILMIMIGAASCRNAEKNEETTTPTSNVSPSAANGSDTAEAVTTTPAETLPVYDPASDRDWALYVIGNDDPLPENFTVDTKTVAGERMLDSRCAEHAIKMLNDASQQGVGLFVTSAYRSTQKQAENLQSYINTLMGQGYSEEEATIQAQKEIALPGHSEHNAGLAMDIVSDDYWSNHADLDESFEELSQFDWLIANSWKYGFILSYPKGKDDITGFIYEPWHYRYVGLEHAERIHKVYEETGEFLTINEYIEKYMSR